MKEYTIHLSDKNFKVKGDGFELDSDGVFYIYHDERIIAIFNLNNIIGFEEHII